MTWENKQTICQELREIAELATTLGGPFLVGEHWKELEAVLDITSKIATAINMAKKMDKKLREYKQDYDKDMWEDRGKA